MNAYVYIHTYIYIYIYIYYVYIHSYNIIYYSSLSTAPGSFFSEAVTRGAQRAQGLGVIGLRQH